MYLLERSLEGSTAGMRFMPHVDQFFECPNQRVSFPPGGVAPAIIRLFGNFPDCREGKKPPRYRYGKIGRIGRPRRG